MRTIAIDTSLAVGAVAAFDGGRTALRSLPTAGEHARLLTTAIEAVTTELGWSPAAAELVGVVRGPGSFTGLRVGVTTAKALCWATGSLLVGIRSSEVLAAGTAAIMGRSDSPVNVVFDAGRGELFTAVVAPEQRSPSGWRLETSGLIEARRWLAGMPSGSVIGGPGLALLDDELRGRQDLFVPPREAWAPDVAILGRIARLRAEAGEADDPAMLVPDYIRPSYADEKR